MNRPAGEDPFDLGAKDAEQDEPLDPETARVVARRAPKQEKARADDTDSAA